MKMAKKSWWKNGGMGYKSKIQRDIIPYKAKSVKGLKNGDFKRFVIKEMRWVMKDDYETAIHHNSKSRRLSD
jgi:hypothetical protein